jgi:hypothetical protein
MGSEAASTRGPSVMPEAADRADFATYIGPRGQKLKSEKQRFLSQTQIQVS